MSVRRTVDCHGAGFMQLLQEFGECVRANYFVLMCVAGNKGGVLVNLFAERHHCMQRCAARHPVAPDSDVGEPCGVCCDMQMGQGAAAFADCSCI